jgi:hypothetical protein
MFAEVKTQAFRTEEVKAAGSQGPEWLLDGIFSIPPRRPSGFAVENRVGLKHIREAYQMATDTWVGAD